MPNIRVKQALERIHKDLREVYKHISMYSGVKKHQATEIDNEATAIAETAADIAGLARQVQGDRSGQLLHKNVRKALGFTKP